MTRFQENITFQKPDQPKTRSAVHWRSMIWIALALIALLLDHLLPSCFWERWYYEGFFPILRRGYDAILGWLPIPVIYLLLLWIIWRTIMWFRLRKRRVGYKISKAIGGIAVIVFTFYLFWGYNYHQMPFQERMDFNYAEVDSTAVYKEFLRASDELDSAAAALPVSMTEDQAILAQKFSDRQIRPNVKSALALLGMPHQGNVRVRQLWPKGTLLRWSTAGIYIPQAFEGHIDDGLLSVQKPFTIAHEMAHGYGVTDEGVCNFIAWLSCEQSDDPWIKYSGTLTYWKYAAYEVNPDSALTRMKTFPPVVERSLKLIRENDRKYPDLFPRYRDAIYSSYLKHHGVKEGLRSYDEVVMMVEQYLKLKAKN